MSGEWPSQSSIHAASKEDPHLRSEISGQFIHGRPTRTSAGRLVATRAAGGGGVFWEVPSLIRFGMQHKFMML